MYAKAFPQVQADLRHGQFGYRLEYRDADLVPGVLFLPAQALEQQQFSLCRAGSACPPRFILYGLAVRADISSFGRPRCLQAELDIRAQWVEHDSLR